MRTARLAAAGAAARAPADARPTILFAHRGEDWIRGAEQCLLDLVERLDRTRFRPVVVCDAPTLVRAVEALDAPVLHLPRWGRSPVTAARTRRVVRAVMADERVALVHANMPDVLPVVAPAAYGRYVPVLTHLHVPYLSTGERHRVLVRRSALTVGVAEHVVAPLRGEVADPSRVRVVPNAVHDARLQAGEARALRAGLGIAPSACVAAVVGSLIPRKGQEVALRALAAARAAGADVHLLVCGEGPDREALRALAGTLDVADAAHFLGMRPDVGAVLRDAADLLVSAAREEALPLNVLEAQWLGLPVIASDIPAHREALEPGVTGIVVAPDDAAALAAALASLAADPARRTALGAAGRARARARYAMPRYVGAFEALYAELLAAPRRAYGGPPGSDWPRALGSWLRIGVERKLRALRPPPRR